MIIFDIYGFYMQKVMKAFIKCMTNSLIFGFGNILNKNHVEM